MTKILKFFHIKSDNFDDEYLPLPPHYDDLSIKTECLPSYDEIFTLNTLNLNSTIYSQVIDKLYKMGPKSYIVIDSSIYDLKKLTAELAINNHNKLTLFNFIRYFKDDARNMQIVINNTKYNTTKNFIVLGFNNIDIQIDGKVNTKQECTLYTFQINNGKYFASCLSSKHNYLENNNHKKYSNV